MNFEFHPDRLFLVGVAASAGGIQPMADLLAHASCHGSMSFVLVPHLMRDRETILPKILERSSNLAAVTIENNMPIENCKLYIIPPGCYVEVEERKFKLTPRPEKVPNQAANVFFSSLAKNYGPNAVGVVLSGAAVGADGSEGVKEIKLAGGHTYAQSPETADFPDMPQLAIDTGYVDSIDTPEAIGHDLSLAAWATPKKLKDNTSNQYRQS